MRGFVVIEFVDTDEVSRVWFRSTYNEARVLRDQIVSLKALRRNRYIIREVETS